MNEPKLIEEILENVKTIAVVGISNKPDRPSYSVSAYIQRKGYQIVPVNPVLKEVLGEDCYPSLREIPFPIDMVNVFRASEFVPQIVEDTIAIGAKYLWLQEGIVHPEAIAYAEANGIKVVGDLCLYKEHAKWQAAK
ncbi:MAG: CoA-binding protein [Ktedonobacteraceae bacterium]|nr:CoA-binding protein [Ktedonobacteraceae bacterium]